MTRCLSIILAICLAAGRALAQEQSTIRTDRSFDRHSTLEYYLQHTDWVVVATLKTPVNYFVGGGPIGTPDKPALASATTGVDIEVQEVIKGKLPSTSNLLIELRYLYATAGIVSSSGLLVFSKDDHTQSEVNNPYGYHQGEKYVFFLQAMPANQKSEYNGKPPFACTADPWFGVLPFSDTLVLGLKQAVADPK